MKRIIALLLFIMTVFSVTAFAEEAILSPTPLQKDIDVIVNGKMLELDVAPVIVNDRTMVPMRAIFEALDAKVTWVAADRLIIATCDDKVIVLQIDNTLMTVQTASEEAKKELTLDAAPFIHNDRTLVPARAVSEALEAKVEWDGETRTVTVTKDRGNAHHAGTN